MDESLLEPPSQEQLKGVWRDQAALLLDREMRKLARAHSLVDLRLCQVLARLGQGGAARLGFVTLADYGRERLGLSDRYVRELVRVGRRLEERPLLVHAMERGEVGLSQVRQLVRVAGREPADQNAWLARAKGCTVRRLEQRVRDHLAGGEELDAAGEPRSDTPSLEETEEHLDIAFRAPARLQGKWHWVLELARRVTGSNLSSGKALELVLMEFLSGMLERLELPQLVVCSEGRWPGELVVLVTICKTNCLAG